MNKKTMKIADMEAKVRKVRTDVKAGLVTRDFVATMKYGVIPPTGSFVATMKYGIIPP